MSFYYLTPVKGDLPTHLLEVILHKRLSYLKSMSNGQAPNYNEYVVEGSIYDNVGHFMLCIIAILGEDRGFSQFVLKTEVDLFRRRITSQTAYEMRCFSKKLLRNIRKLENVPKFVDSLQVLCQHLILKDIAQHISGIHSSNCKDHNIKLNFRNCLSFVAKRQVELSNGLATIPCGLWNQYLILLFKDNVAYRISKTDLSPLKSDPRIMELLQKIKKEFILSKVSTDTLLSKNVDEASQFFPPCMLNLHLNLRKKHRLSHTHRFHYSLFLKDIGMPIDEAVKFWRSEYSLHPSGHHSCSHNWEKDEKKYIYGLRHMYGLEGRKKNYASVNCQRIQSIDNSNLEGGCPFKSFDSNKMIPLLKNCTGPLLTQINEFKKKDMFTTACILFMQNGLQTNNDCDTCSFNFTPVKYYLSKAERKKDS